MNVKDLVFVSFAHGRCGIGYIDEVETDIIHVIGLYMDTPSPHQPPKYPPLAYRWMVSPEQCHLLAVEDKARLRKPFESTAGGVEDLNFLDTVADAVDAAKTFKKKKKKE